MIKEGKTIFFSTHILDVAEKLRSKVGIIKNGELIQVGKMDEINGKKHHQLIQLTAELAGGTYIRFLN